MTLDARVRTVEAMEWVDFLEALPDGDVDDFSPSAAACWAYSLRFLRMKNHHTRNVTIATKATPPITPPAMAPALFPPPDEPPESELSEDGIHLVVAHSSQD